MSIIKAQDSFPKYSGPSSIQEYNLKKQYDIDPESNKNFLELELEKESREQQKVQVSFKGLS